MKNNNIYPPLYLRLYSVWFRHMRVYTTNLLSNAFPPFLEPILFLMAIGLGLGKYITAMNGIPYIQFLASGLIVTSSMFTASFECTFGTFIRLEFDHVYDGMLGAPLSARDIIAGEIIWCATKGMFFSLAVLGVFLALGVIPPGISLLVPLAGLLTGGLFSALSLLVTSFVKNINHFNFYFTGFLTPLFYFTGAVFPLENFPPILRIITNFIPLTGSIRISRALCFGHFSPVIIFDVFYMILLVFLLGEASIRLLSRRMID